MVSGARDHPLPGLGFPRRTCRRSGACGRARIRARARRLRLRVAGPALRSRFAAAEAAHELPGRPTATPQRTDDRAAAREELLRRNVGNHHQGAGRGGLARHRARSDRFLQVEQAGALPVQLPAAGREHACPPGTSWRRTDRAARTFDRRNARRPVRAAPSGASRAFGARQPHRSGGLEGTRRALAQRRRVVRA